jgi:hypothetical protein
MKLNAKKKEILAYGAGAGLAVIVPFALVKFVDKPGQTTWQRPSVIVPLATGAVSILLSQYTKVIKNKNLKKTVMLYGITSVIVGALEAFAGMGITAARLNLGNGNGWSSCAAKAQYQNLRNAGGHTNMPGTPDYLPSNMSPDYWTSTYYPNFQGNFLNRPQSRARGWASDVTRNPMAALPSVHTSDEIIA